MQVYAHLRRPRQRADLRDLRRRPFLVFPQVPQFRRRRVPPTIQVATQKLEALPRKATT